MNTYKQSICFLILILSGTVSSKPLSRRTLQLLIFTSKGPSFPAKGKISKYLPDMLDQYKVPIDTDQKLRSQHSGNGVRMDYQLGYLISKQFPDFFEEQVKTKSDIYSVTSHSQTSSISAQSFLLGLLHRHPDIRDFTPVKEYSLPPFPGEAPDNQEIPSVLPHGYYPFPVHMMSFENDSLFKPYSPKVCERFFEVNPFQEDETKRYRDRANEIVQNVPELIEVAKEVQDAEELEYPYFKSNLEFIEFFNYLRDMRYFDQKFGLKTMVFFALNLCANVIKSIEYFDGEKLKLFLTPLLEHVKSNVSKLIESRKSPGGSLEYPKLLLYAGNNLNLFALLQLLGLSSSSCIEDVFHMKILPDCYLEPAPGSSIILELFETGEDSKLQIG